MNHWTIVAVVGFIWAYSILMITLKAVIWRNRSSRASQSGGNDLAAKVLLVRPCSGTEPSLFHTLTSIERSKTRFAMAVRITVATKDDPARPVAEKACEYLRSKGKDTRVVVGALEGPNGKAGQLANLMPMATEFEVVVSADSDTDLSGTDLDELIEPLLRDTNLGAVWAPPAEIGSATTMGDRVSAAFLNGSLHSFSLLSKLDPDGFVGKLFAFRLDAVNNAGGFSPLVNYLGEDVEMARRLHEAGHKTIVVPAVARSVAAGRTLKQIMERFGRWLMVVRAQRPARLLAYPLMFGALWPVLIIGLSAAVLGRGYAAIIGLSAVGLMIVNRLIAAVAARAYLQLRLRPMTVLVDAVLSDLVSWVALVRALRNRQVSWRGRNLRITSGGLLEKVNSG